MPNRRLAFAMPIPTILGLEECIDGAVMEYFEERGVAALAIEGGKHDEPETAGNLEAAVWICLAAAGLITADAVDLQAHRQHLRRSAPGMPTAMEVIHRQEITPEDCFVMEPGFESFDPVKKGTLLARDIQGEVRSQRNCRVLLPLYQGKGDDGFFLVREVSRFWLWLASAMRWMRLDRVAHWLPGVRRARKDANTLVVDRQVARWFVVELFHLLGYRKHRTVKGQQRFTRRRVWR